MTEPLPEQQPQPTPPTSEQNVPRPVVVPWVLVAVLALVSASLGGLLMAKQSEVNSLRAQMAAAPASPTQAQQPPGQAPPTAEAPPFPQPATDPQVLELMRTLPRRAADDYAAMGKTDTPVALVVWSDYRCPFCSKWANETLPALQPYVDSGSLRIEHRDLVLFGEESRNVAIAARAAGLQGKYWEFAHEVHSAAPSSGHPEIGPDDITKFATAAGVPDMGKFQADLADPALAKATDDETQAALQISIKSTPFFVINDTFISGAYPTEQFEAVIESYGGKR